MNERHWYLKSEPAPTLRFWILAKMTTGAMYGALVFVVGLAFIFIFVALAGLLPPESKEATDPSASLITAPAEGAGRSA
jgi:hypothetical protein